MTDAERLEQETKEKEAEVEAAAAAAAEAAGDKAEKEGLSEEEVNKKIEAARKQEKDKLYGEISSLKDMVKDLKDQADREKDAKDQAAIEADRKIEEERTAKLSNEDRLAEQLNRFEERLAQEAVERERLEKELKDEREQKELEKYRQQLLSTAGDEIISDLVSGHSKEDIDRSVAFAKSRYQELFQATKKKAEGNVKENMPGPSNPTEAALEEAELQSSVQNFKIDEVRYMKDPKYKREMDEKREAVLDRVGSAYQKSVGR